LSDTTTAQLAILGGEPSIGAADAADDLTTWPIVGEEDERAVLDVLRAGSMSGFDITRAFEAEFAKWQGRAYALAHSTGTGALQAAMYALGLRAGDEVVCQSTTYWASALPALSLGASVRFADIDPQTLCIDPADLERRLTERTKLVVVVHYSGHPADMEAIRAITEPRGIALLEDVSHAHGGRYRGTKVGNFGPVAAMSIMSEKALPAGEGGMLVTDDRGIYERALAWGHYSRGTKEITDPALRRGLGVPLGGYKYRLHQMSAAVGRVQLRHFEQREVEIRRAMNRFWDALDGVAGIRPHRVDESTGSTMGGWYNPHGIYVAEELGGLSLTRFLEALEAEGVGRLTAGVNLPLHLHPVFRDLDVYGRGAPSNAMATDNLPVAESIHGRSFHVPWFKHDRAERIERYAQAFRKVVAHAADLRQGDTGNPPGFGIWPGLIEGAGA
jgi:perosamine synthetase